MLRAGNHLIKGLVIHNVLLKYSNCSTHECTCFMIKEYSTSFEPVSGSLSKSINVKITERMSYYITRAEQQPAEQECAECEEWAAVGHTIGGRRALPTTTRGRKSGAAAPSLPIQTPSAWPTPSTPPFKKREEEEEQPPVVIPEHTRRPGAPCFPAPSVGPRSGRKVRTAGSPGSRVAPRSLDNRDWESLYSWEGEEKKWK